MQLSDPTISVADKQNWVWSEIARRFPEFKRENFPVDDPHTLAGMILDDCCRYVAKPGDIVMDIGANVGVFTVMCAAREARVLAFEPGFDAFQLLLETVRRNGVEGLVRPVLAAIAPVRGTTQFAPSNTESDGWRSLNGTTGIGDVTVPVISFHEALWQNSFWDCVKMDIEGDEFDVLLSVSESDLKRIKYLTVEFHHNVEQAGKYEKVLEHLGKVFTLSPPDARDHIHYSLQATRK